MLSTILPLLALAATVTSQQQITSQISQSGSYIPSYVECPKDQTFVRPADSGLSSREMEWLKTRKSVVTDALQTYLNNVNLSNFDVKGYIETLQQDPKLVPTIAMTLSGGGQRAEVCALGLVQAMDARYQPALDAGTGGLLQALTYQSGCEFRHVQCTAELWNQLLKTCLPPGDSVRRRSSDPRAWSQRLSNHPIARRQRKFQSHNQ